VVAVPRPAAQPHGGKSHGGIMQYQGDAITPRMQGLSLPDLLFLRIPNLLSVEIQTGMMWL
jgi:hypothetical protein